MAAASLATWAYLVALHGRFWLTTQQLPSSGPDLRSGAPRPSPSVVAIVPARDEAAVLPSTLPSLLAQDYRGEFRVVVVDDASDDGTGDVARALGACVVRGSGPPPGWVGKVAAMAAGVAAAGDADYLLFTDADIRYPQGALVALVDAATANRLDVVSQMVRLRAVSRWERLVVPAFVYFFAQLYPFARVNSARSRVAAAAGGCMLVRKAALDAAGGLAQISDALIDDVALGRLLKRRPGGGRVWLGLSPSIESVREYPRLADLWNMVARSAYTQLRHSPSLLLGTVAGLLLVYAVPPAATIIGLVTGSPALLAVGLAAWMMMAGSYLPILRFYRLAAWRAAMLPLVAALYLTMTIDSAWQHARGKGGAWKGRTT